MDSLRKNSTKSVWPKPHAIRKPVSPLSSVAFRFNWSAKFFDLLNNAGFKDIYIEAIGGRFIVFYDVILPKKLFPLRLILSSICLLLNKLYEKFHSAEYNREMYPSGYFFIAKK